MSRSYHVPTNTDMSPEEEDQLLREMEEEEEAEDEELRRVTEVLSLLRKGPEAPDHAPITVEKTTHQNRCSQCHKELELILRVNRRLAPEQIRSLEETLNKPVCNMCAPDTVTTYIENILDRNSQPYDYVPYCTKCQKMSSINSRLSLSDLMHKAHVCRQCVARHQSATVHEEANRAGEARAALREVLRRTATKFH